MTRMDIYKYSKDRDLIGNHKWRYDYMYVRLGSIFLRRHDLVEINILNESNQNDDEFTIKGKVSKFEKFKIILSLVLKILKKTSLF